ncbi:MAG: winged helix-turn-helix domain-containing protein [Lysobacteraceae bacterium]
MDDFTDHSQFRIGDLLVVPASLVVVRNGQEIKFEPRWMQVLVMLAEHANETLSTERLLIDVWGSTIYGDSPVSKTISHIRKSIGDDSRKPRYIETVSKVGYKLIEPVSLPEDYRRMPSERWTKGSPYVGLSAFDADHASVFCGRSRIVADLLRAMRIQIENQRRFVLIVGASGCGKTSLLRAGAIPLLIKPDGFDGLRALSVTTCDLAANGHDPLIPLTAALATWTLGGRPVFPPQTPDQLKALLTKTPEMIAGFVSEAFQRHFKSDLDEHRFAHLLLTVDHAEALVATTDIDANARDAFAGVLQALCACPHVLVTMITRGDFYLKLIETLPVLAECKAGDGHLDVIAPRYGEIGEIIRSPAWKADLSFETDPLTRTRLDDALRDAALSQPDALPLLQHTLQILYEHRNDQRQLTFVAYNEIGGLEGAVAHRAEQVFATLPADARTSLDTVLAELIVIQPDSDAVSARRADTDGFDADARMLIDTFIRARLFVGDQHNSRATIGVIHEALLRRWPRAEEWVQNNRRLLQARARLKRATDRWVEERRSPDHLLNPGMPLIEAAEVAASTVDLSEDELALLSSSQQYSRRRKTVRIAAIIALAALAVVSTLASVLAIRALEDAEQRRIDAERLADYMLGPLADELRPLGKLKLLSGIGRESLDYLHRRDQSDLNPSELAMLARGSRTVGEALKDMGKTEGSRKLFEQAVKLSDAALSSDPDLALAIFERGNAAYWLGLNFFESKDYKSAEKWWLEYLEYSKKLTNASPAKVSWIMEESYGYHSLGALAERQGNMKRALELLRESEKIKLLALAIEKKNIGVRYELITTQSWISTTLESMNKIEEASVGYDRQIESLQSLILLKPESSTWKHQLANFLQLGSKVDMARGDVSKAKKSLIRSNTLLAGIISAEPEHREWTNDMIRSRIMLADVYLRTGEFDSAMKQLTLASADLSEPETSSENAANWGSLRAKWLLVNAMTHPPNERLEKQDEAINIFRSLSATNANDDLAFEHASALIARGRTLSALKRTNEANVDWENALRLLDPDAKKANRYDRLRVRTDALLLLGRTGQARSHLKTLLAIGYRHSDFQGSNLPVFAKSLDHARQTYAEQDLLLLSRKAN